MSVREAARAGLGFFTRIPIGISMPGLESLMRHQYLFPLYGLFIGLVLAGTAIISGIFLPSLAVPIVVLVVLYVLTGLNHLDGLCDFGDALAAHGDPEQKIRAMKDVNVGVGGVAFTTMGILALFIGLTAAFQVQGLARVLVVGEVTAKTGMILVGLLGEKLHDGFGAMNVESAQARDLAIGVFIALAVGWLLFGPGGVLGVSVGLSAAVVMEQVARRSLGGVSGDVIGAANEVCRIAAVYGVLLWLP